MEFSDVIRKRRSVRGYLSDPVSQEKIDRILDAACMAPTATNAQPVHLIVVTDPAIKEKLRAAYDRDWFLQAPVIMVGCVVSGKAWKRADGWNSAEVDLGIVFDHLILAATAEGLGTCWVCNFDESAVREALQIPPEARAVAMTPLGVKNPQAPLRPFIRKSRQELVSQNAW
jgi:nitroreductase